jgi:hypothetical protein
MVAIWLVVGGLFPRPSATLRAPWAWSAEAFTTCVGLSANITAAPTHTVMVAILVFIEVSSS